MSVVQEIVLRLFVTRGIIVGMHFRTCTLLQQACSVFGSIAQFHVSLLSMSLGIEGATADAFGGRAVLICR